MRSDPAFISTQPHLIRKRYIQKSHAFRRADGSLAQFPGSQVISIARVSPLDNPLATAEAVRSILTQAGHLPDIVDAQHGYRSTGTALGDRGTDHPQPRVLEAAVRVTFPSTETTNHALEFLRQSDKFDCQISLCRAPATTQTVINHSCTRRGFFSFLFFFIELHGQIFYWICFE